MTTPTPTIRQLLPELRERSLTALAAGAAAIAGLLCTAAPADALPRGVSSPSDGVICDAAAQSCYTRDGVSLQDTRRYFGPQAERRLWVDLIGRRPSQEFSLSNGTRCDLREETCWSDNGGRRRPEQTMTRDLFAKVSRPDRDVTSYQGRCSLVDGTTVLHNGDCALRLVERRNGVTRYVVTQPDGRRFNFTDRSGRLEVTDATGTSAVTFIDHGYTGVFRWRTLTLVATRENQGLQRARNASDGIGELFSDR
ncbi:conserved hypothetical protein [Cyanobium sp. PCC 7001]|uniref:YcgJ family protein n=1 Tax=Cyanobium sp. PCC 7001 TaxID=180281 RepID=UPI00018051E4|nr:YcgJ family protein [Cyanobium sp. PCC 7001]EDY37671.1 conserved hypothetical protein [Cyanobium sp. PCC 7001]